MTIDFDEHKVPSERMALILTSEKGMFSNEGESEEDGGKGSEGIAVVCHMTSFTPVLTKPRTNALL